MCLSAVSSRSQRRETRRCLSHEMGSSMKIAKVKPVSGDWPYRVNQFKSDSQATTYAQDRSRQRLLFTGTIYSSASILLFLTALQMSSFTLAVPRSYRLSHLYPFLRLRPIGKSRIYRENWYFDAYNWKFRRLYLLKS